MTWFFRVRLRSRWGSVGACTCATVQVRRCSSVPRGSSGRAPIFHHSPRQENENDDKFKYVYVDNIGVLATSQAKTSKLMAKLTTTFDDAGLLTHEVSVSDSQGVSLGTVLDC